MHLELENIGGLKGKYEFDLQKGLNLVVARNGRGASSIVRGLRALIDPTLISEVLFQDAIKGSVVLSMDGKEYKSSIRRTSDGIVITPSKLTEEYSEENAVPLASIVIVDENHPLTFGRLSAESLSAYLSTISHSDALVKTLEDLETRVLSNRSLLNKLIAEQKKNREQVAEYDGLNDKLHKIKDGEWDLEARIKKNPDLKKASVVIKKLTKAIVKLQDEGAKFDEEIAGLDREIASWEAQLGPAKNELTELRGMKEDLGKKKAEAELKRKESDSRLEILGGMLTNPVDECPICTFLNLPCNISSLSHDELRKCIEKGVVDAREENERRTKELNQVTSEWSDVVGRENAAKIMSANVTENIRRIQSRRKDAMMEREARSSILSKMTKTYDDKGEELAEAAKIIAESDLLKKQRQEMIADMESKFANGRPLRLSTSQKNRVERQLTEDEGELAKTKTTLEQRLHAVRNGFNTDAARMMENAGYFKFSKLFINENFQLVIERDRLNVPQPLGALSTSEITSIAVLIATWGKKIFCPKFPFLAIDTVSTFYDAGTFKWASNVALSAGVHVIITRPVQGIEKIQIQHDFKAIEN